MEPKASVQQALCDTPLKSFEDLKPTQQATIDAVIYMNLCGSYMSGLLSGVHPDKDEMARAVGTLRALYAEDMQRPGGMIQWEFPKDMLYRIEAAQIRNGSGHYTFGDFSDLNALCDRMEKAPLAQGPSPD